MFLRLKGSKNDARRATGPAEPFAEDLPRLDAAVRLRTDFHFVHEPVSGKDHFAGRLAELDELITRLLFSTGGSFLVTGYRGVGKTSFVNQVVKRLTAALPWARQHLGLTHIADVYLSLAKPVEPSALMHYIVRRLYDRLCELGLFSLLPQDLQGELRTAYQRTTYNMVRKTSASVERSVGKDFGLELPAIKASIKLPFELKSSTTKYQEFAFLGYDDRSAEYDIIRISQRIATGLARRKSLIASFISLLRRQEAPLVKIKLVFVFDELDKLEDDVSTIDGGGAKPYLDYLLGGLKTLFTTSGISFIFVAGKDLHERWLEDVGHGDSIYESVFSYDRYLGCLWADASSISDALVSDTAFTQPVCKSCRQSWRQGDILCSNCGKYLKDADDGRTAYQDFFKYVTFRGRGIPRRMIRTFNQAVRWHGQWPVLAFTREERRVHRLFAGLIDLLGRHDAELYPDVQEESPGARSDRVRLAVHYVIDWMMQQGKSEFSVGDLMRWSEHLSKRIAPDATVFTQVVSRLIEILLRASFLETVRKSAVDLKPKAAEASQDEIRYRVPAYRLNALGGRSDLLPEDIAILENSPDLGRCGKYKLLRRVATGGMAMIYLANDTATSKLAVVKVLLPDFSSSPEEIERFRQEAAILKLLRSHRNIVQYYDAGDEDGRQYIAMEYIDGIDLGAVLKLHGKLLPDLALAIAVQVAEGFAYVHGKNVFRNDVSSRNIMLTRSGRVELIDFGIAIVDPSPVNSMVKTVAGTPPYMAPERFRPAAADSRSDVYSLGIVVYEMLTGRRPFQAAGLEALERAHEREEPKGPSEFAAIPSELNDAVMRALEKDPDLRFASMSEFREALIAVPGDLVPTGISNLVSEALRAKHDEEVKTQVPGAIDVIPRQSEPDPQGGPGEFTRMFEAKSSAIAPPPPIPQHEDAFRTQYATQYPAPQDTFLGAPEAWLLVVDGPSLSLQGKTFAVVARISIGRSAENDVVLDDAKASRFHAEIFRKGSGRCFISDLNTANGTKVDGRAIRQPEPLEDGSRIEIGEHIFEFGRGQEHAAVAAEDGA